MSNERLIKQANSVTKLIAVIVINLVTPKAAAKREQLFIKLYKALTTDIFSI
jgi:hypothetical protein